MKNLSKSSFWTQSIAVCLCAAFASSATAQIAVGGNYTLTQTAIANGGVSGTDAIAGGNYSVEGTIGQSAAGTNQQAVSNTFQPGFWTAETFAPTAAGVFVSGRILAANGIGIRNVRITLTAANGETRTSISSAFGYFLFENVAAGETYIFSVFAKRFTFNEPTQVRSILENTDDIIFTANGENESFNSK